MAQHPETVVRDVLDPGKPLRAGAVAGLSSLDDVEREVLRAALPHTPLDRRRHLVQLLIDLGEDDATLDFEPVLTLLLDDADPDVRRLAIDGLWEYDDRSLIDPLLRLFERDADVAVRAGAALALGRFVVLNEFDAIRPADAEKVLRSLRAVIDDPAQPADVRRRAVEAAGANSEPWARAMIWRAFDDPDPGVQVSALHAMGRNADRAWLPTLYDEMGSADAARRFEAAGAAGSIGDEDAVPYLVDLFDDADPEVQEAAVQAVGEIGGELAVEVLREHLPAREPRMTVAIGSALSHALTGERLLAPTALGDDAGGEAVADDDFTDDVDDA